MGRKKGSQNEELKLNYQDLGCRYAPKCTKCPFPLFDKVCLLGLTGLFKAKVFLENRDEIIYKSSKAGKSVEDIAKVWKLSTDRVRHIIAFWEYKKIKIEHKLCSKEVKK